MLRIEYIKVKSVSCVTYESNIKRDFLFYSFIFIQLRLTIVNLVNDP